jgi:hypothetical protein
MQIIKTLRRNTMNKLLNPISWSSYLETITVLAIAYYAYIGWKYYRPEIDKLINRISGRSNDLQEIPDALRYQGEKQEEPVAAIAPQASYEQISNVDEPTAEFEELSQELNRIIESATDKPFAPASLISRLKKILNDFPEVAATTDREKINALIVRECERTGTALLSESEVDMWWSA